MKAEHMNRDLKQLLTRVINDYARKNDLIKENDTNYLVKMFEKD